MENKKDIQSWPDLAIGLYDALTGRKAEITYDFDNFTIGVPKAVGSDEITNWTMNGKLKIST
ncbi:MAG: hypothetical protein LAT68_06765 [Cyclobacteriaceae bacterium]|nr:hypothetical protein [Cyclobacteriaceae bacterium]